MSESPRAARGRQAVAGICAVTVVFLAVRDLWLPEVRDVEVWFGFELHGLAARVTAPLHWAIFATFAWAFWRAKPWAWQAAAAYVFTVAASHEVWNLLSPHGHGWLVGLAQAAGISLLGVVLLLLQPRRDGVSDAPPQPR